MTPSTTAPARWLLAALLAVVAGCRPPPSEPSGPRAVEIVIDELPLEGRSGPLFGRRPVLLWEAIETIRDLAEDGDARGVFLRVGPLAGGWARTQELEAALAAVRAAGKPVHCHFEAADNASYGFLASACDRLTMTPAGDLSLVGVAAQLFYLEPLLAEVGVRAEILQVGDYKGGADPFTEREMPAPVRENLGKLLDDQQRQLVEAVGRGRDLAPEKVRGIIDRGPFGSGHAAHLGLVDDVVFADGARQALREAAGTDRVERLDLRPEQDEIGLIDLLDALGGGGTDPSPTGQRVAVVHLSGQIVDGDEGDGDTAASGPFVRALKRFRDDDEVRAVVLRVASPGGSALASDVMWHAVESLSEKKPVIASLGDMAASGGYYIAVAADEIVANPGTIVGSIGVFGGKVDARALIEEWGVRIETLSRGEQAAWLSPFTPWDEGDRARLRRSLDSTYDRFIRRVLAGRPALTPVTVVDVAQGRVFAGATAVDNGLVDRLGNLQDAVDAARERAGLGADAGVEHWPPPRGLLEALAGNVNAQAAARAGPPALPPLIEASRLPARELFGTLEALVRRDGVLLMAPYALRIE